MKSATAGTQRERDPAHAHGVYRGQSARREVSACKTHPPKTKTTAMMVGGGW